MRLAVSVVGILLCLPCGGLLAQGEVPLPRPGARIRLTVPCDGGNRAAVAAARVWCSFDGELVMVTADSLTIRMPESTTGHAVSAVSRLEVSRGYRPHRLAGAGAGFLVAGGLTYLVLQGGGSTSLCDRSANQDAMRPGECLGLAALGGLAGAGLGAVIGGFVRTERWQAVPVDRLRFGLAPRGAGMAILSLTF